MGRALDVWEGVWGGSMGGTWRALRYTRPVLGERCSLGRAAALLACCPPATALGPGPWAWVYLGLLVVQAVTRVPLSFCLGPRLVNVVSLRKQSNFLRQKYRTISTPFDIFPHFRRSPVQHCQLLPLWHLQLTQQGGLTRRASLRSTASDCCFCNYCSRVKLKPTVESS
jgi:hypothetical protein